MGKGYYTFQTKNAVRIRKDLNDICYQINYAIRYSYSENKVHQLKDKQLQLTRDLHAEKDKYDKEVMLDRLDKNRQMIRKNNNG